ncbi:MAG: roadblock/LC7 domain-containing protein [Gemmatimonadales bacterium]
MSIPRWEGMLREITGIVGVRGALIVSADDGLVVAESAMDGLETTDVAAFAASLISRAQRTARAMHCAPPTRVHITAESGTVFAVAGDDPLWLVAVTDTTVELGRLRLLLGDLAVVLT